MALGDGSVKFISENIPIRLFARLVTRDQDEPVDGSYYEAVHASLACEPDKSTTDASPLARFGNESRRREGFFDLLRQRPPPAPRHKDARQARAQ